MARHWGVLMGMKRGSSVSRKIGRRKFSFGVKWAFTFAVVFEFVMFYSAFAGVR
jgi:hypothetical protein